MYTQEDKEKYKKILLDTLKAFNQFCDKHKIKYFACGGTAIGAVRHKGIIPWDDDIDVCMLREDYNRFIELKDLCRDTNYKIVDSSDKGYYLPFAKFMDRNTTIWEVKEKRFILGVFIDIFPLNYTTNSLKENESFQKRYNATFEKYVSAINCYSLKDLFDKNNVFKSFKRIIKYYLLKINQNKFYNDFRRIDNIIKQNREGDYLLNYYTPYKIEKEIFPKEWFTEQIDFPFEDTIIKLPNGYNQYLTQLFGDYMTPPPLDKQISHHHRYYINLDRYIPINSIFCNK